MPVLNSRGRSLPPIELQRKNGMCSGTIESVLILENVFWYYRMPQSFAPYTPTQALRSLKLQRKQCDTVAMRFQAVGLGREEGEEER